MHEQGLSWETIQQKLFPQISVYALERTYSQETRFLKGTSCANTKLSSADKQVVGRLLSEGKTWRQISSFLRPELSVSFASRLKLLYLRQTGEEDTRARYIPLEITAADVADIERLRDTGMYWRQIVQLKYPGRHLKTVHRAYTVLTGKRSRKPLYDFSVSEVQDIERLREDGKTWPQIRDLKYPERSETFAANLLRRYLRDKERDDAGLGKMSFTDVRDIERMRQLNATWDQIRALKYPKRSERWVQQRFAFLRDKVQAHGEPAQGEQVDHEISRENKEDTT